MSLMRQITRIWVRNWSTHTVRLLRQPRRVAGTGIDDLNEARAPETPGLRMGQGNGWNGRYSPDLCDCLKMFRSFLKFRIDVNGLDIPRRDRPSTMRLKTMQFAVSFDENANLDVGTDFSKCVAFLL